MAAHLAQPFLMRFCSAQSYQSVKPRVLAIIDAIIGECRNSRLPPNKDSPGKSHGGSSGDDRWRVYVTGHSMGGAHATLCAYELGVSDLGFLHSYLTNQG